MWFFFQEKLLAGGHTFSIDDAASNDDHYADGKMVKFLKMAVEPEKREIKRKKVDSSEKIFSPFSSPSLCNTKPLSLACFAEKIIFPLERKFRRLFSITANSLKLI